MCRNWLPFPGFEFSVSPTHCLILRLIPCCQFFLTLSCLCLFSWMLSRGTAVHIDCLSFVCEVSGLTGYTYVCVYDVCMYICMYILTYLCIYTHHALLVLLCMLSTLLISSSALLFIITAFGATSWKAGTWKTRPGRLISIWILSNDLRGRWSSLEVVFLSRPCSVAVVTVLRNFGTYRACVCLWSVVVFNIL
jgi:hypothetical protein